MSLRIYKELAEAFELLLEKYQQVRNIIDFVLY
jgi:hypothetical protein